MKESRKEKIHLVFDTNVLRSEPFYSRAEYDSLQTLVEYGHVEVYIPELVEQEYLHQLKDDFDKYIESINKSNSGLERSGFVNKNDVNKIKELAANLQKNGSENIEQKFSDLFYADLSARKLEIKHKHTKNVFNNYFSGSGVFASKKERKDIPDAFIFEAIKELKSKHNNVVGLIADKRFSKACSEINLITYEKIKDFLESDDIQEILANNSQKDFIDFIIQGNYPNINIGSELIDNLAGKEITSKYIPSDNHDATIMSVGEVSDVKLNLSAFTHLGGGKLSVPFSCIVNVSIMFFVFKADYYAYDQQFNSVGDWNKHYFDVEEEGDVLVKGDLVLDFSGLDFTDPELEYMHSLEDIIFEVNSIEKIELIDFLKPSEPETIECKCSACGNITNLHCNDFEWELTESNQRNMGSENCYTAKQEFICDCGNDISVEFNTWEYPAGMVNMTDSTVNGCTINKECTYDVRFK